MDYAPLQKRREDASAAGVGRVATRYFATAINTPTGLPLTTITIGSS